MTKIEKKINFFFKYRIGFLPKLFTPKAKIYFYPEPPHHRTIMFKVCKQLGIKIINNPNDNYDFAFFWDDKTFSDENNLPTVNTKDINTNCTDISKEKVDRIFKEVFGYDLSVDPKIHNGKCVIKSNENAQHDGQIINCPIDKIEGNVVYQKVIDNKFDENYVIDLRVPVLGDEIPFVYYKFKTHAKRFTNDISRAEFHKTEEVLSSEEIKSIIAFGKKMGLDYGELDILRDNYDKRIYIVDVNKTPWGPPATLPTEDCELAVNKMSKIFKKVLLSK